MSFSKKVFKLFTLAVTPVAMISTLVACANPDNEVIRPEPQPVNPPIVSPGEFAISSLSIGNMNNRAFKKIHIYDTTTKNIIDISQDVKYIGFQAEALNTLEQNRVAQLFVNSPYNVAVSLYNENFGIDTTNKSLYQPLYLANNEQVKFLEKLLQSTKKEHAGFLLLNKINPALQNFLTTKQVELTTIQDRLTTNIYYVLPVEQVNNWLTYVDLETKKQSKVTKKLNLLLSENLPLKITLTTKEPKDWPLGKAFVPSEISLTNNWQYILYRSKSGEVSVLAKSFQDYYKINPEIYQILEATATQAEDFSTKVFKWSTKDSEVINKLLKELPPSNQEEAFAIILKPNTNISLLNLNEVLNSKWINNSNYLVSPIITIKNDKYQITFEIEG
ncbi:hypothetical protein ACW95P_04945 [Candidatus Mycoplasma pogonae]